MNKGNVAKHNNFIDLYNEWQRDREYVKYEGQHAEKKKGNES